LRGFNARQNIEKGYGLSDCLIRGREIMGGVCLQQLDARKVARIHTSPDLISPVRNSAWAFSGPDVRKPFLQSFRLVYHEKYCQTIQESVIARKHTRKRKKDLTTVVFRDRILKH